MHELYRKDDENSCRAINNFILAYLSSTVAEPEK